MEHKVLDNAVRPRVVLVPLEAVHRPRRASWRLPTCYESPTFLPFILSIFCFTNLLTLSA